MPIKQNESPRSSSKPGREGTRCSRLRGRGLTVPNQATARALEPDIVSRLARFFPEATPVRIPIKLSRTIVNANGNGNRHGNGNGARTGHERENENVFFQNTVIEFGTAHEVLFVLDHPLQFADRVLVESNDGSLHA